jgi:hypothetical protein
MDGRSNNIGGTLLTLWTFWHGRIMTRGETRNKTAKGPLRFKLRHYRFSCLIVSMLKEC